MDTIIKELSKIPLSGIDIYNTCEKNIKIIKYGEICEYQTIDQLFGQYDAIALLYESKPNYGHWVLLLRHSDINTIEFFCSYGLFIDDHLKYIDKNFKQQTNQDFIYLSKLLLDSGYKIIYNNVKIQKLKKGVSTCGRHICLRYIMRNIPLKKYIKIMNSSKCNSADDLSTLLTSFI